MVRKQIGVLAPPGIFSIPDSIPGFQVVQIDPKDSGSSDAELAELMLVVVHLQHPIVDVSMLLRLRTLAREGRVILHQGSVSRELKQTLQRFGFFCWLPRTADGSINIDYLVRRACSVEGRYYRTRIAGFKQDGPARAAIERALLNGFAVRTDQVISGLFQSLQASLSQRKGFGTLLSLLCSLEDLGERCEQGLTIPMELEQLLKQNVNEALDVLKKFGQMSQPVEANQTVVSKDLKQLIYEQKASWNEYSFLRHQRLLLSEEDLPDDQTLPLKKENWRFLLNELVLNAMRFSPQNSAIVLVLRESHCDHGLDLQVINKPHVTDQQRELFHKSPERLFDPFFRASYLADDRFPVTDLGIGLTFARKLLHSAGGSIFLELGQDHSRGNQPSEILITRVRVPWIDSDQHYSS